MGKRFRISLFFLIICICTTFFRFGFPCSEAESRALFMFKHNVIDKFNCLGSWVGEGCCNWKGVGCDNITGNVIKLDLGGELCFLEAGEVNSALLELKYLTYLDFSFVDFMGSRFPQFFGSMRKLKHLNLSNTHLSGKVPHNLGNLTDLVVLDLSTRLEFEIKANNLEWAFGLEKLQYLELSGINLTQARQSLSLLLHHLPSLSVLNLANCGLRNSHTVTIKNSTLSYNTLQHLNLSGNHFSGPIPHFLQNLSSIRFLDLSYNDLSSSIPPWLGNKVDPKHLSLAGNSFNGSFPLFIQNSSSLTSLDLSWNQFSQSIPSWLANKTHLEYLDLNGNQFNRVDRGITNTIGFLCRLRKLDLSNNQLQEEVAESHVNFSRCSRYDLQYLFLQNNNISGYLPIIGSLSSLLQIDVSSNNLEGLPPSLAELLSLESLDLSHNNFSAVSPIIGSLSSLKFLDLSKNNLETPPSSFGRFSSLRSLDLSYNNLSVVHQVNLANLSSLRHLDITSNDAILDLPPNWKPPFKLYSLRLKDCKLNSRFPKWILSQENISDLDLSNSGIFGPLPTNIGTAMPSLQSVLLANNQINGSIPRSLCELGSLQVLDLQKNRLSGIIPDFWENSGIDFVELSSNEISGPIPHSLANVTNLTFLSLNNNSIEGELSLSLSNSTWLELLDEGRNNLHGKIPHWINGSNFPHLKFLIMRENRFKGTLPQQLCSVYSLQIIDFGRNDLSGTIPPCFGHFQGMRSISTFTLPFNGWASFSFIPSTRATTLHGCCRSYYVQPEETWSAIEVTKGKEREYTTNVLDLLVNMDLSCNHLVGVIPSEITNLYFLFGLNLSHNHLNGTIPKEIGNMAALESLDLSGNNLTGSIPESISSLDYLSVLNLSFNNLEGRIPTGRHLQTLEDPSTYMGNPSLCGNPLPKKCFGDNTAHPSTSVVLEDGGDNKQEKMWFYMVIMSGFAVGFWGVIGILIVHKRWRVTYFRIAEELADWMCVKVAVRIAQANIER